MLVKFPLEDLDFDSYPSYLINTYIYIVTIASRMYGGHNQLF